MKSPRESQIELRSSSRQGELERGMELANARLRHFRGIAASVMSEALGLWKEIWDELQDPRSCLDIINDASSPSGLLTEARRGSLLERLHLLGIQIEYARRLCEGSIGSPTQGEGESDHGESAQSRLGQ
ncbi:MAG: hypothetical protein MUC41_12145 [Syntrophobacteraceae bacterium]|nr:hypothetical protein [Syntrophobacteraceae bacterium]